MMGDGRALCGACQLPLRSCLCALVAQVDNATAVLVLQHPREAREAKGSVRLLGRCLAHCKVVVGEVWNRAELDDLLHADGHRSVLLYPALEAPFSSGDKNAAAPTQLVLLDGTWGKSLRMLKLNPALEALPRWRLEPVAESAYAPLRKARRPGQLSTLEAACLALAQLEGAPARYQPVQAAFQRFVAAALARRPNVGAR